MPWALGGALIGKGSYEEGAGRVPERRQSPRGQSAPLAALAFAYARSGQKDEARKILTGLRERGEDRGGALVRIAGAHVALGETDEAWPASSAPTASGISIGIVHPHSGGLKPLRSDPRYQDLVRRIGWPGAANRAHPGCRRLRRPCLIPGSLYHRAHLAPLRPASSMKRNDWRSRMRIKKSLTLAFGLLLAFTGAASAQIATGNVYGVAKDESGARASGRQRHDHERVRNPLDGDAARTAPSAS